jgi:hypothetical protein
MNRIRTAAAVLVLASLGPGCGGSRSSTTPTTPTSPSAPGAPPPLPADLSPSLTAMLQGLSAYIALALQTNEDNLPRNPQIPAQIQAKITMLQNPSLPADIINGRRWAEIGVPSSGGRSVPISTVFALESMRAEAGQALQTLAPVLALLEEFFAQPFPTPAIRLWYGFVIGNSGGGGSISSEDRTTYEARTGSSRLPYDAILCHELGHSYIDNESLTQFLEIYAYNIIRTGATDPLTWSYTRSWTPDGAANQDSAALMDIYKAIGPETMKRAYRAIYPLRPGYGQPLSTDVIQAFVAQVPESLKPSVAAKLAKVTF